MYERNFMSLFGKLVISLLVAALAAAAVAAISSHGQFITLFAAFSAATIITSLLGSIKAPAAATTAAGSTASNASTAKSKPAKSKPASKKSAGGKREEGDVKWFNVSKGFGFISRDSGEEIFVHFRSIRGEGRRSLRDGQRVSFVVADSDKGLQAEEVDPID
jgi:CspA family cold shock protein